MQDLFSQFWSWLYTRILSQLYHSLSNMLRHYVVCPFNLGGLCSEVVYMEVKTIRSIELITIPFHHSSPLNPDAHLKWITKFGVNMWLSQHIPEMTTNMWLHHGSDIPYMVGNVYDVTTTVNPKTTDDCMILVVCAQVVLALLSRFWHLIVLIVLNVKPNPTTNSNNILIIIDVAIALLSLVTIICLLYFMVYVHKIMISHVGSYFHCHILISSFHMKYQYGLSDGGIF